MNNQHLKLSVVMPSLNEEVNIESAIDHTLDAFKQFSIDGEILVVNDGSTDRTREIVEEKSKHHPNIILINHDKPWGMGGSFWDGVDHANGNAVLCIPGDDENEVPEILRYFDLMNHVDIVIPFVYNKETRSLFRNALSFTYRFIINSTFGVYLNYTNGTVIYRKSVLMELPSRSHSFFFQTDILIRLLKRNYLFAEVPYRLSLRKSGESKAVSFPSLLQVIKGYLRLVKDLYGEFGAKNSANKKKNEYPVDTQSAKRYNEK